MGASTGNTELIFSRSLIDCGAGEASVDAHIAPPYCHGWHVGRSSSPRKGKRSRRQPRHTAQPVRPAQRRTGSHTAITARLQRLPLAPLDPQPEIIRQPAKLIAARNGNVDRIGKQVVALPHGQAWFAFAIGLAGRRNG